MSSREYNQEVSKDYNCNCSPTLAIKLSTPLRQICKDVYVEIF
jgi:hypothetical protein